MGGVYQGWAESLVGPSAVAMIGQMYANYAMVSASGISDWSCYHPYEDIVAVKRAMLDAADTTFLLLDHTKFARKALFCFASMAEFSAVIVDRGTPEGTVEGMRAEGVEVVDSSGLGIEGVAEEILTLVDRNLQSRAVI